MAEPSGRERIQRFTEVFDELRATGKSSEEIFVVLYADLKQLARMKVAGQPAGASVHATRLLSDLYVRLFGKESSADFQWESAKHFFNTMALAMEQLLIDHSRRFTSHGGGRLDSLEGLAEDGFQITGEVSSVPKGINLSQQSVERAIFIKELLDRLENDSSGDGRTRISTRQVEIVRLRVFAGLTEDEAAGVLGCSSETITKEFSKAKAKLASYARREMAGPNSPPLNEAS